MNNVSSRFRRKLRCLLEVNKLTISQAAREIGTSRPSLSRIINGHEHVSLERAERISNYFGMTITEFLR